MGIIYLIQPVELIGTNRYKIGCSRKDTLERINTGYKKGTICVCICECKEPTIIEKELKNAFSREFKLIAGAEYFEGDKDKMRKCFTQIANNAETLSAKSRNANIGQRRKINLEIIKRKIDHLADIDFGGDIFHIWFQLEDNIADADIARGIIMKIAYIDSTLDDIDYSEINVYSTDNVNFAYIDLLIKNRVIQNAVNYDLNDDDFITALFYYKKSYNVIGHGYSMNMSKRDRIIQYVLCDAVLNDEIYCTTMSISDNTAVFRINGDIAEFKWLDDDWQNAHYVDKHKKYIKETNTENGDVLYLNKFYEYIGHDVKVNPYGWKDFTREYI